MELHLNLVMLVVIIIINYVDVLHVLVYDYLNMNAKVYNYKCRLKLHLNYGDIQFHCFVLH